MDRVALTFLALITGGVLMSLILSKIFRSKWVWYIPSISGVLAIAYLTWKIWNENMEGFEELGYVILTLMVAAVMTGNILTNIIIAIRRRKEEKETTESL